MRKLVKESRGKIRVKRRKMEKRKEIEERRIAGSGRGEEQRGEEMEQ